MRLDSLLLNVVPKRMSETNDTLSLYFGLHEGKKADLEVVSRAAIEWVNSVRHASKMIAPTLDVRVEFVNAHESSLSINTVLEWSKAHAVKGVDLGKMGVQKGVAILDGSEALLARLNASKHPNLKKLAIAFAVFVVIDSKGTLDAWLPSGDEIQLSQEDRDLLNDALEVIEKSNELKHSNRKFFNIVGTDPAISSVGICKAPKEKPIFSVPSSQFAERGGLWELQEELQERYSERVADVVLEVPNLSPKDLKWRFSDIATGDTFTAKMRDQSFIKSIEDGDIQESLRSNIRMQVVIRFKEQLVDKEWEPVPSTIEVTNVTLD